MMSRRRTSTSQRARATLLGCLAALVFAAVAGTTPALAGGVWWHLASSSAPANLPPGGQGQIIITASNLGYEDAKASAGTPLRFSDAVPVGLEVVPGSVKAFTEQGRIPSNSLACPLQGATIECVLPHGLPPYGGVEMIATVKVTATQAERVANVITITGGEGPPTETATSTVKVDPAPTQFGIERYVMTPENEDGTADKQAGSHPFQLTSTFDLNQILELNPLKKTEEGAAPALARNLHFVLPPGLLGNVTIVPQCTAAQFATIGEGDINFCPPDSAIGVARVSINEPNIFQGVVTETVPVFNLEPAPGEPARFGIELAKVPITLTTAVRTGSDYAVEVTAHNTTQVAGLLQTQLSFWGVPGDPRHDSARGWQCVDDGRYFGDVHEPCTALQDPSPAPFVTLPAACSTASSITTASGESWPEGTNKQVFQLGQENSSYELPPFEGCNLLGFSPTIETSTDTQAASTPAGITVGVKVDQRSTLSATGLAEADVKATTVVLPEGVQASPAAANGLLSCSAAQVGYKGFEEGLPESSQTDNTHFTPADVTCPDAAKVGAVAIRTPLLKKPLTGSVYLASQDTNPFATPLILYLFAEDPESGVKVKLAGEVRLDPATGRLTSVFGETPPVPFEELTLSLFGGPRASQSTPPLCGVYTSTASFTPSTIGFGGEALGTSASFPITTGVGGTPCPTNPLPLHPSMLAGSSTKQGGAFAAFSLTIGHADTDQALQSLSVHLPAGVAAVLASVTPCPVATADAGQCGAASLIGHSTTTSGLGSEPISLAGQAFLTGPYHGAPFGISVLTPAEHVGPFNLGRIVANSTIQVDPSTAAVTVTTVETRIDEPTGSTLITPAPLPTIIHGVPVQLKQINVTVDRPSFQFNPTNCSPLSVTGTLTGSQGTVAAVSTPFQVANCAALPFRPVLTAVTKSTFSKGNGASLTVKVASTPGQANIAKTRLVIPASLPSRLTTIQKACADAIFAANPASCNEGSLIGMAVVHTPVLRNPLMGPGYLVSHGNAKFPDVEFVLQGEGITLVLDGLTDIHNGVTTSTFNAVPDAPVSSFEAILPQGPHSALTAYLPGRTSICGTKLTIPTTITGQNGLVIQQTTKVAVSGCAAVKRKTRAQLLAAALKACKKKRRSGRGVCERHARRKYAIKHTKGTHKRK